MFLGAKRVLSMPVVTLIDKLFCQAIYRSSCVGWPKYKTPVEFVLIWQDFCDFRGIFQI